jgi:hypothetical protein
MDQTFVTQGFVVLSGVVFTGGGEGTAGSTLTWTGFLANPNQDQNLNITDTDANGFLVDGTDSFAAPALVYTGYTIKGTDDVLYPVFFDGAFVAVPLPVDGTGQSIIPSSGTSEVYSASTSGTTVYLCFGAGTKIATPAGEMPVETLKIGDQVLTEDGGATPVLWLGHQTVHSALSDTHMQLVRISAGALGDGLPHSDLTVTADHGMVVDGLVITAGSLVNGRTINWVPGHAQQGRVTVYHVETQNHDVIFANGAPSETFADCASRRNFDNYDEYLALYGAERIIPDMPRPRLSSQRMVPAEIRRRLAIGTPEAVDDLRRSA